MSMDPRLRTTGRSVRPLDLSSWDAFDELCANSDGFPSGCYCIGFHEEGPVAKSVELNRGRKHQRVLNGTTHAVLVFDGDLCIGWCQFGPPDEVVRIKNRREYDKTREGELGFTRDRMIGKHRWVVSKIVDPN